MPLRGHFVHAKKMALALHALIEGRYPHDTLYLIGFSDYARRMQPEDLAAAGWERVYGTNMHHAFNLAGRLLSQHPRATRQVIMVTDGEPTAHLEGERANFNWPPIPKTIRLTLAEAMGSARAGVTLNVFMLEDSPGLIGFMERLAELTAGRVFLMDDRELGTFVVRDYVDAGAVSPAADAPSALERSVELGAGPRPCARRAAVAGTSPGGVTPSTRIGSATRRSGPRTGSSISWIAAAPSAEAKTSSSVRTGAQGTAGRLQRREPLGGASAWRARLEQERDQRIAVADARLVRGEALVRGELGTADHLAGPLEEAVVAGGEDERPVGGLEQLVRDDVRVGVAQRLGDETAEQVVRRLVHERGDARVEQRHRHARAAAGPLAADAAPPGSRCSRRGRRSTSSSATPTFVGSPPGWPVKLIRPESACTMMS